MKRYKTVDDFITGSGDWQAALTTLRRIMNETDMEETVKWGAPCYTVNGKNVVGLGAFKSYVGLWFFQGALLKDADKVLVNAQDGATKALRQWRFNGVDEIDEKRVKAYVLEAIENQKQGREIKADRNKPLTIPAELQAALDKNPAAASCFNELSKGKQREYADHIADAKRDETRQKRLDKIIPMILAKKGLHDKYRT